MKQPWCHFPSLFQVDFDESSVQNRFVVKTGVDPELDQSLYYYKKNLSFFPVSQIHLNTGNLMNWSLFIFETG